MGLNFTIGGGSEAPDVEAGVYPAKFLGVELKDHPDWAGTDAFGKEDDGKRFHWGFVLYEGDEPMYEDGEPLELEGLTRTATGEKSNTAKFLKGLMTPAEFDAAVAGTPVPEESLVGRRCQVEVAISKKGWPNIVNVIQAPQPRKRHSAPQAAE